MLWNGVPRWMWRMYWFSRARRQFLQPLKNRAWLDALIDSAHWGGIIERLRHDNLELTTSDEESTPCRVR